jgi:hypothetical protein
LPRLDLERLDLERLRLLLLKARRLLLFLEGLTARRLNVERLTRDGERVAAGRLGATERRGFTVRVRLVRGRAFTRLTGGA